MVKHGIIEVDEGVDPTKGQKKAGWSETQGFKGKRLSSSSDWQINLGDRLEQRYNKEHLGLREVKLSRDNMSQTSITISTWEGIWNSSNESIRIDEWILCSISYNN